MQAAHELPERLDAVLTGRILGTFDGGSCSIDVIADRMGVKKARDVRRLNSLLRELVTEELVQPIGVGKWVLAGAPRPDRAEPVVVDDVLRHGFGERAAPLTVQKIRDNVHRGTGKDMARFNECLAMLLDAGMIAPTRSRCFELTSKAMSRDTGAAIPGMPELSAGKPVGNMSESDRELAYKIRTSGPAERRALAHLSVPMSQRALAAALGVTRERTRQVANRLVERGLVGIRYDQSEDVSVYFRREAA